VPNSDDEPEPILDLWTLEPVNKGPPPALARNCNDIPVLEKNHLSLEIEIKSIPVPAPVSIKLT